MTKQAAIIERLVTSEVEGDTAYLDPVSQLRAAVKYDPAPPENADTEDCWLYLWDEEEDQLEEEGDFKTEALAVRYFADLIASGNNQPSLGDTDIIG